MRNVITIAILLLSSCAALPDEDDALGADDAPQVESHEQAATTQPWQPSGMFNEAFRGWNYYTATTPSWFSYGLTAPNTQYQINGMVRSGDNVAFTHSYAAWSITLAGTSNLCVLNGCSFVFCFENASRGWGICTETPGQGTTSSNMELHGSTAAFAGLRLSPYEFSRWTLAITTFGYWPATATVKDLTITAYQ